MMPSDRRATVAERRERAVVVDRDQPEQAYRGESDWAEDAPFAVRRPPPFAPPRIYRGEPVEAGPGPFPPPWYYRDRPLAWGPYPGVRIPPPMPW